MDVNINIIYNINIDDKIEDVENVVTSEYDEETLEDVVD